MAYLQGWQVSTAVSWNLSWCHGPEASVPLHVASPWTVKAYLQHGEYGRNVWHLYGLASEITYITCHFLLVKAVTKAYPGLMEQEGDSIS